MWNAKRFLNGCSIFFIGLSYIWFKKVANLYSCDNFGEVKNCSYVEKFVFHSEGSYGILKTFIYIFYMSLVRRYLDAEGEVWLT